MVYNYSAKLSYNLVKLLKAVQRSRSQCVTYGMQLLIHNLTRRYVISLTECLMHNRVSQDPMSVSFSTVLILWLQ